MNNKTPNDELGRPDLATYVNLPKFPIKVLLDDVRSLSNVGSVFRTCDAFNVEQLILSGITGHPPHREIQKTALGATESVDWIKMDDPLTALLMLKREGYTVVAVEQCAGAIDPRELSRELIDKVVVILGNEVNGVRQEIIDISDAVIEIPQLGTKHSLNVTVAAGIVLWELFKHYHNKS